MANIAIIGAGVVGLTTAMNIKKRLPTARLTVYADRFGNETTSSGAGGLFRPNVEHVPGVDPDTIRRWSIEGFRMYSDLAQSPAAGDTGHMILPGYVFSKTEIKNPLYKEIVFSFRELTTSELRSLGVNYKYGYQVTTIITDMSRYLPWLMNRFKESGGVIVNKHIRSIEEFVGKYDLVVNCSGLRSGELVGDKSVYPIRGHLIKVKAPWIKYWVYTDDLVYFIPSADAVALGGIREKGNTSREVDPRDTAAILDRNYKLWPALKDAPVISEWVDLRPHRDPIRIERETMKFNTRSIEVVHNYGHGAHGISLSWGTSVDAANLVIDALKGRKSKL